MSEVDEELAQHAAARIGQTLARKYHVERVLGVGGMAVVYVATHRNGRRVAIKMLHPELSRRAELRKRFLREGQAANAVKHDGVVAVVDDDVAEDGAAFLVMELLDGASLEDLWVQLGQRLPTKMVLALARELCDVLDAAHAAGVVHRDLKPANLFLTKNGTLKVLDFGLAQLRDSTRPKLTATGIVFGTPAFMAPEQAQGRTSQLDRQTDLWAVGATMFTLLSGGLVHRGESAQAIVMQAATQPAPSLATLMPHAAAELVMLVDRALAFDKSARWKSAFELREAICDVSYAMFGDRTPELVFPGHDPRPSDSKTNVYVPPQPTMEAPADPPVPATVVDSESDRLVTKKRARLTAVIARSLLGQHPYQRLAAAAAGFATVAVVAGLMRHTGRSSTPPTAIASQALIVAPEPLVERPITPAPTLDPAPIAPTTEVTQPTPSTAPVQVPPTPAIHLGAPVTTRPAPPRTSASGNACVPPYTKDVNGQKRWKLECL